MLDQFLAVAYEKDFEKTASRQMVDKLKSLPTETLLELAGNEKLAWMDGCSPKSVDDPKCWLDMFKGTPLFEQALELERADLQLEQQDIQRRMEEQANNTWTQRDALRLKKRMLELDLAMQGAGGGEGPEQTEEQGVQLLEQAQAEERAQGEGGEPHEQKEDAAIQQFRKAQSEEQAAMAKQQPNAPAAPAEKPVAEVKVATALAIGRLMAKQAEPAPPKGTSAAEWDKILQGKKTAAPLTLSAREHIKPKNFAEPKADGPGDTGKYPIEDKKHAKAALGLVGMHGSSAEKAKVRAAVAEKYPSLGKEKAAASNPEGHHLRRALLGNPLSSAIEAAPGKKLDAYGEAHGHAMAEGWKGLGKGALIGGGLGAAAGALSGFKHAPPGAGLRNTIGHGLATGLLGAGAGGVLGSAVGEVKGHHDAEASRIHGERSKHKTAGILGSALTAGKAALPQLGAAATGAKNLIGTAYKSGGLGQVAKSVGNVAGGFAKANPVAAAGVAAGLAGGAGLAAGRLSKSNQPRV